MLVCACLLAAVPDHTRLFFRAEAEFFIEARRTGAEPEEFDFFQAGMAENALDEFGADSLPLIGLVDDDVPDRCAIDVVGEYSTEPDESFAVPRADK